MDTFVLVKPSEEYVDEIRAYRQSFLDYDSEFNGDSGLKKFENITEWINHCRLMENKETVPNPNWVEAEQFMLICKGTKRILGMINFRHHLNDYLAEYGGHIGYGVCPTERKKGYAKVMLTLCLEKCRARGLNRILITCDESNEASRRTILSCGGKFEKKTVDETRILERYWITLKDKMNAIAYCGLACCVCSGNKDCIGCQDGGCEIHGWCKNYNCCKEKGLNGCWECAEFPCAGSMLDKPRIRAFTEFTRRYGTDELEKCLLRNKEKGIVYHYEGQVVGDYDRCQTEEEIIDMIKTGEVT